MKELVAKVLNPECMYLSLVLNEKLLFFSWEISMHDEYGTTDCCASSINY